MLNMKKALEMASVPASGDLCNFKTLKRNQCLPKSCFPKLNTLSLRLQWKRNNWVWNFSSSKE